MSNTPCHEQHSNSQENRQWLLSHDYTLFTYEDLATVLMRRNNGAEDNMTGDVA
jgi:hypothetical protein